MRLVALLSGISQLILGSIVALIVLVLGVTMFLSGERLIGGLFLLFFVVNLHFLNRLRKNPYRVKYKGEPWS